MIDRFLRWLFRNWIEPVEYCRTEALPDDLGQDVPK